MREVARITGSRGVRLYENALITGTAGVRVCPFASSLSLLLPRVRSLSLEYR